MARSKGSRLPGVGALAAAATALVLLLCGCTRERTEPPAARQAASSASIYDISLDVTDNLETATGSLRLHWSNTSDAALDHLQLFLFPNLTAGRMDVTSCTVSGKPAGTTYDMRDARLIVALSAPLAPGASVDMALDFTITVPPDPAGENGGFSRSDNVLALAWCWPVVRDPSSWDDGYPKPWADYQVKEQSSYSLRLTYPAECSWQPPGP